MIPALNIVAWGNTVPWAEQRQVEQDLIISRGIVAIFADPLLKTELRFRGGTALNKLHFRGSAALLRRHRSRPHLGGADRTDPRWHPRRNGAMAGAGAV